MSQPATLLQRDDTALMVIDVQGRLARQVVDAEAVTARIVMLIHAARTLNLPVLWVEQYPEGLGPTVKPVADALAGHTPFAKTTFNACENADIASALSQTGRSHLIVCGIETHVCVYHTVAGLIDSGFSVSVMTDGCSSRRAADRSAGLARMQTLGAALRSTEMTVFELIGDAADPAFNVLLPLLKE
ncbi:isochorismatase family protein [Alteromonas sp. CYL-A6]|uniref:isochorismatase family protein n=1 Tax=Alteromonas nitratireducens TaxID=3390813 RepID=UPI0034BB8CA4